MCLENALIMGKVDLRLRVAERLHPRMAAMAKARARSMRHAQRARWSSRRARTSRCTAGSASSRSTARPLRTAATRPYCRSGAACTKDHPEGARLRAPWTSSTGGASREDFNCAHVCRTPSYGEAVLAALVVLGFVPPTTQSFPAGLLGVPTATPLWSACMHLTHVCAGVKQTLPCVPKLCM